MFARATGLMLVGMMCSLCPDSALGSCEDLACAVGAGDISLAKTLINEGADVNKSIASAGRSEPLLMRALKQRDSDMTVLLLRSGADALLGEHPHTALTVASMLSMTEVVSFIIDNELVDLNREASENKPFIALDYAVSLGDVETARLLLENGANASYQTSQGVVSGVSAALFSGNEHMIPLLAAYGADLHGSINEEVLQIAVAQSHPGTIRMLLEGAPDVLEKYPALLPSAHQNCRHQERMVELLLSDRPNCWAADRIESMFRREKEWRDLGSAFLSNGAIRVFQKRLVGCSEASIAVDETLQSHFERRDDPSLSPIDSFEAASIAGEEELVIQEINAGTYVCDEHFSLLHRSIALGRFRVINYLLMHPQRDQLICTDKLGLTEMHLFVLDLDYRSLKQAIALGSEPDPVDRLGYTPLFFALALGADDIGELLLSAGADLYRKTQDGRNALHLAAVGDAQLLFVRRSNRPRFDISKLDIAARDAIDGRTPLHSAIASQCSSSVGQSLMALGLDPCKADNYGKTSLDYYLSVGFDGRFDEGGSPGNRRDFLPDCP